MNLINNECDFACQKLLVREAHEHLLNFEHNLSATLINHYFQEIEHIKNIKICGIELTEDNVFAFRIDFLHVLNLCVILKESNFNFCVYMNDDDCIEKLSLAADCTFREHSDP